MRQVFLDCGAHCGCSRRKWNELHPGYEIFSFEADPELCDINSNLVNAAVWIEDGEQAFYKFGIDGGSSLKKERADIMKIRKPNYYPLEVIRVPTIDLNKFILDNFSKDDYIILKLDIEGAEYQVIPNLIQGGAISLIKEFYIEWHDVRVGVLPQVTQDLTTQLAIRGITPKLWDAMEPSYCIVKDDEERRRYHVR